MITFLYNLLFIFTSFTCHVCQNFEHLPNLSKKKKKKKKKTSQKMMKNIPQSPHNTACNTRDHHTVLTTTKFKVDKVPKMHRLYRKLTIGHFSIQSTHPCVKSTLLFNYHCSCVSLPTTQPYYQEVVMLS